MVLSARFGVAKFGESYFGRIITTELVLDGAKLLVLKSASPALNLQSNTPTLTLKGAKQNIMV